MAAFLLWEAWWAYEFIAAPRPDEEMRAVAALFFGVVVPVLVGLLIAAIMFLRYVHGWGRERD